MALQALISDIQALVGSSLDKIKRVAVKEWNPKFWRPLCATLHKEPDGRERASNLGCEPNFDIENYGQSFRFLRCLLTARVAPHDQVMAKLRKIIEAKRRAHAADSVAR
jgi:hypothetical protein